MAGKLLLAKPYLGDENFERSVVVICENSPEGSFGLVINQVTDNLLSDYFDDISVSCKLYIGGPMENNRLHFIHKRGDLIEGSLELAHGLYWSGNFEQVRFLLNSGEILPEEIKFLMGYSGWGANQLEEEIEEGIWIESTLIPEMVFQENDSKIWSNVLRKLGGNYIIMANSPLDPRLN